MRFLYKSNGFHILDFHSRGRGGGGASNFQYITYLGCTTLLGANFCARPRFWGRNLCEIQILGVKFEADPTFLGPCLRKTNTLESIFGKNSSFGPQDQSLKFLSISRFLTLLFSVMNLDFWLLFWSVTWHVHFDIDVTAPCWFHGSSFKGFSIVFPAP